MRGLEGLPPLGRGEERRRLLLGDDDAKKELVACS
jgi:hypothetical protein